MGSKEYAQIFLAVLLMLIVFGFAFVISGDPASLMWVFIFSFIIILVHVFVKKLVAYTLDASVEHRIWQVYRFGFRPREHFKRHLPMGAILPLALSLISVGILKVGTFLTYETHALKHRAAKRFGFYSYTEMTDWHNGLIGASGIISLLLLAAVSYIPDFELLSKMAVYYAFWNMIPVSDLDGTQIFFGSRILWMVLALTTLVFVFFASVL